MKAFATFIIASWLGLLVVSEVSGCGMLDESSRIVGGAEADPNSIPWQVALVVPWNVPWDQKVLCGGTIICSKYILTAAHCTVGYFAEPGRFQVVAGEHDILDHSDQATRHSVKAIYDHPNYVTAFKGFDYSILELDTPIDLSAISKARAACLPDKEDTQFNSDTKFVVSGWGKKGADMKGSTVLHHVTLPWVDVTAAAKIGVNPSDMDTMMCAGNPHGSKVSGCEGDSGGPLTWKDPSTSRVKVVGVVSFGPKFCNSLSVFAKVTAVLPWINEVTGSCNSSTDSPSTNLCEAAAWKGDGYCDDGNNNAGCDWDGGDCCNNNNPNWNDFCTDCKCLEP